MAKSTGAAKKAPAKAAKTSAKTVKTAKEKKDTKPKARGKKKTVDDTQSSAGAKAAEVKAPSKKTSTKAQPKPALAKVRIWDIFEKFALSEMKNREERVLLVKNDKYLEFSFKIYSPWIDLFANFQKASTKNPSAKQSSTKATA